MESLHRAREIHEPANLALFPEASFSPEGMIDSQTWVNPPWISDRYALKKWTKQYCHFRESKCWRLLSKFKETRIFELKELLICSLRDWQHSQHFLVLQDTHDEVGGDINKQAFWYHGFWRMRKLSELMASKWPKSHIANSRVVGVTHVQSDQQTAMQQNRRGSLDSTQGTVTLSNVGADKWTQPLDRAIRWNSPLTNTFPCEGWLSSRNSIAIDWKENWMW